MSIFIEKARIFYEFQAILLAKIYSSRGDLITPLSLHFLVHGSV
jgi:hypothetical protein